MAKRTDLKKILVIGSGPIVIGQAAEFDYAGTQACLALKEEGYEVVLCNSNPATIMTDTSIADKVYMEPVSYTHLDVYKRQGKGAINNRMTNLLFQKLEKEGIPTHFIQELNDRETAVRRVEIIPLEVIVRNVAAGSFSKRLGIEEGTELAEPTLEFSYRCV